MVGRAVQRRRERPDHQAHLAGSTRAVARVAGARRLGRLHVRHRAPADHPHRLGGALIAPYDGRRLAAWLGTYLVLCRIDEETATVCVLSIRLRREVYGRRQVHDRWQAPEMCRPDRTSADHQWFSDVDTLASAQHAGFFLMSRCYRPSSSMLLVLTVPRGQEQPIR